jgi:hypothetical protein
VIEYPKPKTFRSKKYLDFIRGKPCLACGKPAPSDPHHENLGFCGAGMKAPDTHTVPLCRECHRKHHDAYGNYLFPISVEWSVIGYLTEYIRSQDATT